MSVVLIEPKEIEIEGKTYIISKFPAFEGREICTQYFATAAPKIGDYSKNQEIALKMMAYVAVYDQQGNHVRLMTKEHVNRHISNWENHIKLEGYMMEYNCSFFQNGRISNFFERFAQILKEWDTKISTVFSALSLPKEKPPSTS